MSRLQGLIPKDLRGEGDNDIKVFGKWRLDSDGRKRIDVWKEMDLNLELQIEFILAGGIYDYDTLKKVDFRRFKRILAREEQRAEERNKKADNGRD